MCSPTTTAAAVPTAAAQQQTEAEALAEAEGLTPRATAEAAPRRRGQAPEADAGPTQTATPKQTRDGSQAAAPDGDTHERREQLQRHPILHPQQYRRSRHAANVQKLCRHEAQQRGGSRTTQQHAASKQLRSSRMDADGPETEGKMVEVVCPLTRDRTPSGTRGRSGLPTGRRNPSAAPQQQREA